MDAKLEWRPNAHGFEDSIMCIPRKITAKSKPADDRYELHYHDHMELLYGLDGTATALIGDRRYPFGAGDIIIVNSRDAHEVICEAGTASYYVVKFLPEILYTQGRSMTDVRYLLPLWQKEVDYSPLMCADELAGSGIDVLVDEIMREWTERSRGYESIICADIMKIFVWTVRKRCPVSSKREALPESLHRALQAALEAAQENIGGFSAEEAARACNLSYSYFSRSFKKAFGVSFTAYYESLRLHEAERLLLTTERDITDIAAAVGFTTTSYFIERFRALYGTTPRAFRASVGGENN